MKIATTPRLGLWVVGVGAAILSGAGAYYAIRPPQFELSRQIQSGPRLHEQVALGDRWIISVTEAQQLIRQGAVVLDANGSTKHARSVTWQEFSRRQQPHKGLLLTDDHNLTQKLQSLGISADKPVVVVGNPVKAWGEEGRLVWMLRSLGHQQAYVLDGGRQALPPLPPLSQEPGDFQVQRDGRWTIEQAELQAQLDSTDLHIIDSREAREYHGKTPYGETRGGHIAGAKHLYFKTLLNRDGTLLPYAALRSTLEAAGIDRSKPVVVYCTGGIRSGWLTVVLVSLGYDARNYPGSMWEWSAGDAERFPLTGT